MTPTSTSAGFTMADQQWFAAWSGDFNPVHLDPVASRRELTGDVVVHGVHALLATLEGHAGRLVAGGAASLRVRRLACVFQSPIYLGQPLEHRLVRESAGSVRLDGVVAGRVVLRVTLECDAGRTGDDARAPEGAVTWPTAPRPTVWSDVAVARGATALRIDDKEARARFPALTRLAGLDVLADLAAVTRLVGMEVPGQRSMLAKLDLSARSGGSEARMTYQVREADERLSMLLVDVRGSALQGTVTAFVRPEPRGQRPYASVCERVARGAFEGQSALVVGGSRGLGEATAKLVAAGGGAVMLTYRVGHREAREVGEDIRRGGGRCSEVQLDSARMEEGLAAAAASGFNPTHLYYFATPRVTRARYASLDAALFDTYCEAYVGAFARLLRAARDRWPGIRGVFYPSSVTLDEHPRDLVEYVCAKAAGEALCANLNAHDAACRILVHRLPVVATDLSQGLLASDSADATEIMLPIVGEMQGLGTGAP